MVRISFWDGTGVNSSDLREEVERLATEKPETYAACVYTSVQPLADGPGSIITPGCIVGAAVYNLTGAYVPDEYERTGINNRNWLSSLGEEPDDDYLESLTEKSEDFQFVYRVQRLQDGGQNWGDALRGTRQEFEDKKNNS